VGDVVQFQGQPVLPGAASGKAIAADVPLSFWGGFDPETGEIIDKRHPLAGQLASGRVLVVPMGRGSCSGSGVLLEAIRNGTAPAAVISSRIDPIISLGAILGDELYASHPVIVVIDESDRQQISNGDWITIDDAGRVLLDRRNRPSSVALNESEG
jgi:predicted aconitase with swiveling domain